MTDDPHSDCNPRPYRAAFIAALEEAETEEERDKIERAYVGMTFNWNPDDVTLGETIDLSE